MFRVNIFSLKNCQFPNNTLNELFNHTHHRLHRQQIGIEFVLMLDLWSCHLDSRSLPLHTILHYFIEPVLVSVEILRTSNSFFQHQLASFT